MNDLKEFPVVLGCRNCTRCSYYKFVTRVSIETNEIESEPNNISYKLAGTRNDDWGGSSMYPERDDGPVRGNIRSSRTISLRFLVSDIKSIEFSPLPFSFSFFKSTKTRLLRIGKLFFKSFSLDRLLALKRNRVREEENEKKVTRNGWIEKSRKIAMDTRWSFNRSIYTDTKFSRLFSLLRESRGSWFCIRIPRYDSTRDASRIRDEESRAETRRSFVCMPNGKVAADR